LAKEILCLVSSGQFEKARERVKLAQKSKNAQANADDFKILSLLLDLKESGPGTAENSYSQARMKLKDGPHPLAYRLACAFGDAWIQDGQLNKALDCYRDAFAFAPTRIDACDSAKRLMDCMNALGLKAEAADFAMRHFELFHRRRSAFRYELQAARLLAARSLNDAAASTSSSPPSRRPLRRSGRRRQRNARASSSK
jgi:tetratricopeptide (TPR) repeat protein